MFVHRLRSDTIPGSGVPAGTIPFPLTGLPDLTQGGIPFLDRLWLDVNLTDIDNAGGTASDLAGIVSGLTITDGGETWGPENQSGLVLAASRYIAVRDEVPYQGNSNGDNDVGAGTNGTRRFAVFFDYSAFGAEPGDYSPMARLLKDGEARVTFANPDADATNVVGTVTCYGIGHGEEKPRAVPRIIQVGGTIPSLNYEVNRSGAFLQHALQNAGVFVASDITSADVRVGGLPVLASVDPFGVNPLLDYSNTGVTTSLLQKTYADVIGGDKVRSLALFGHQRRGKVSECPIGRGIKVDLTGGETAANLYQWTVFSEFMPITEANRQIITVGGKPIESEGDMKVNTRNGKPAANPRVAGFLSVTRK